MNKKTKVLHTEWSDGWGGQEIRIIGEMIALRENGIELFLACKENSKIKEKAIENGFKVFILPFKGNTDFKTLFSLMKIIKEYKIDIVNTHSGKDTWVGGIAAKLSGAKFIRTRHLSNVIKSSRLNFINELADYIMTTGESVRTNMINNNRINSNKIKSVPTGIDATLYDPLKYNKIECKKLFNIKDDEIVIGIVAVLRQFKRHDVFIEMAKKLLEQYPKKKLKFLIAGEGPQRENIEKLIEKYNLEDEIILLGHVSNVPEFLSAIDIFTLTSDSKEGVPQSVMQALLMSKATISTSAGSTKDLLNNDNFILINPIDNLNILIKNVSMLIDDESLRNRYSIKAREYVENNFSKVSMTKNILKIYKGLLV